MTLLVRTGSLKSPAARRDDALDVTRGTGHGDFLAFAPSPRLFLWVQSEIRHGRLERAWLEYRDRYLEEMSASQKVHPRVWAHLLARTSVTLCCYCENPLRCHRYLLAQVLVELGATYDGEAETP